MPTAWLVFLLYMLCINLIAAVVTALDKRKARRGRWRIPEATLLLLAALGGSPAMLFTMRLLRHKTRKKKFMVGIPFIIVLQTAVIVAVTLKAYGVY